MNDQLASGADSVPGYAELAAAAILGVASREVGLQTLPEQLRPVSAEPAQALLDVAALMSSALRTAVPTTEVRAVDAPKTEHRPVISPSVEQLLGRLLDDRPLLLMALVRIGRAGQVVPATAVPGLLGATELNSQGVLGSELAAELVAVLGTTGEWIARRHPHWAMLTRPVSEGWPEADPAVIISWFTRVRRAEPVAAAALLGESVGDFSAGTRAQLVAALAEQAGDADAELLDRLTEDRSGAVRSAAAALALRLPHSRTATRAADRLREQVRIDGGRIELGEQAESAISEVPPSSWLDLVGVEAATALALPGGRALLPGLRQAALRFGDPEAARAVLRFTTTDDQPGLWFGLAEEMRIDRVMTALAQRNDAAHELLQQWEVWPSQLSRRIAFWISERLQKNHSVPLLDLWVLRVPDADVPQALAYARHLAAEPVGPAQRRAWGTAGERLNLRVAINRHLAAAAPEHLAPGPVARTDDGGHP